MSCLYNINERIFLLIFLAVAEEPEFTDVIENVTVPAGRNVKLGCSVKNLGSYKVNISPSQFLSVCDALNFKYFININIRFLCFVSNIRNVTKFYCDTTKVSVDWIFLNQRRRYFYLFKLNFVISVLWWLTLYAFEALCSVMLLESCYKRIWINVWLWIRFISLWIFPSWILWRK